MVVQPQGCTPAAYRRRRPADTPLYRAVQNHLETFLALCRDDWADEGIAPHAERELRAYLECGILAYGFARARCGEFLRCAPTDRNLGIPAACSVTK
jgi:hypothetical protein